VSTVLIIVLVVLGVLLLLAILGGVVASRRSREGAAAFEESLTAIDRQLAAAVAEDHGWHRDTLEHTAREEFAQRRPGAAIEQLELVQITDEPGTDQDLAVFRVTAGDATSRLTLGRRDGAWYAVSLDDLTA
jgi:type II secretory pathway pseudopilin PulG